MKVLFSAAVATLLFSLACKQGVAQVINTPGSNEVSSQTEDRSTSDGTSKSGQDRDRNPISSATLKTNGGKTYEATRDANASYQIKEVSENNGSQKNKNSGNSSRNSQSTSNSNSTSAQNDDPCKESVRLKSKESGGYKYYCKGTQNLIQGAQVSNQVGTMVGNTTQQFMGQSQVQNAAQQGTQSAAAEAAASVQSSAAKIHMGLGAVNGVMGYAQLKAASKHSANRKTLEMEIANKEARLKWLQLNTAQTPANEREVKQLTGEIEKLHAAANEQGATADQANKGAFQSIMQGRQQLSAGIMEQINANQAKKTAESLKNIENYTGGQLPGFDNKMEGGDSNAPRTGNPLSGSGENPAPEQAAAEDSKETGDDDVLGAGPKLDLDKDGMATTAPPAGAYNGKSGTGGGAGGGGGGLGGPGSTSLGQPQGEGETSARYAENKKNPDLYDSGGTPSAGGRAGGGDNGPDLNGLLAKLLPPGEEKKDPSQSILNFGGGRGLASDELESMLDRSVNIFDRIHKTYIEKTQRGFVGI